jgi:APA family basic amino acid/polyamine antiporter
MRPKANRILVPVDGSRASEQAFRWSSQLARSTKSELNAVYVFEVPLEYSLNADTIPHHHRGEEILTRIEYIGEENKCKVKAGILRARHAGPAIVLEAEERGMELIVLATPAPQPSQPYSLGTTVAYVFKHAPCQVILYRERVPASLLVRN